MTVSQTNPGQLHPPEDDQPDHHIVKVDPPRQLEAVKRLVAVGSSSDSANAQRFMHYAKTSAIALDAMWIRVDGGETPRLYSMSFLRRPKTYILQDPSFYELFPEWPF